MINKYGLKVYHIAPRYQCCTKSLVPTCEQKDQIVNEPSTCDEISVDQLSSSGGVARIFPRGSPKLVSCDVTSDVDNCVAGKGAWTVIQRRGQFGNPKDFFSTKLWVDYANGFGVPNRGTIDHTMLAISYI